MVDSSFQCKNKRKNDRNLIANRADCEDYKEGSTTLNHNPRTPRKPERQNLKELLGNKEDLGKTIDLTTNKTTNSTKNQKFMK